MILGISVFNISKGGGLIHLKELLNNSLDNQKSFKKIIIWANKDILNQINDSKVLEKKTHPFLEKNIIYKLFWQKFILTRECRLSKIDLLYVPGQIYTGSFKPFVTMSQNALPYEKKQTIKYLGKFLYIKLILIKFLQLKSFKKSNGIIFLSQYGKNLINKKIDFRNIKTSIIPHGITQEFFLKPRKQKEIKSYTKQNNFKIIYVSTVDLYKHQWNVVEAISHLRSKGYPLSLDLIGGYYLPALKKLKVAIKKYDTKNEFIRYHNELDHIEICKELHQSDLFVFASSCENLPIALLEGMSSGLPIVCSNLSPMKDILPKETLLFNPYSISDLADKIEQYLIDRDLRQINAIKTYTLSQKYKWDKCINETFNFFTENLKY